MAIRILYGIDVDFYINVIREDGPIENATAIAYFISFIFSLAIASFFKKRKIFLVLFLIFAFGFLFIALEEISWGQRIFNFNTPDWFPENLRGETNIHNLAILSDLRHYLIVSFIGSSAWFVLPKIHDIIFKEAGNNYKTFLRYVVPSKYLISYFFPMILFSLIMRIMYQDLIYEETRWNFFLWHDYEVLELSLSIGILLFVLHSYIKLKVKL